MLTVEKKTAGFVVGSNTLKESKRIANAVRGGCGQLGRIEQGVNVDDFLDQGSHDTCSTVSIHSQEIFLGLTKGVPYYQSKLWYLLSFLAQLHQCRFPQIAIEKLRNPTKDSLVVVTVIILHKRSTTHAMVRTYRVVIGGMICAVIDAQVIVMLLLLLMGIVEMGLRLVVGILMGHLVAMPLLCLVHPWLGLGKLLLVRKNMLVLHNARASAFVRLYEGEYQSERNDV